MKERVLNLLRKYTGHDHIELTSRGNTAIFAALYSARKLAMFKKTVLIPDQGGWLSFKKYPKMLELKIVELKTNLGVIDTSELKKALDENDVNCLIYTNPAGYYAEQPVKEIYDICKGKCTVILDVSGAIGDSRMCNGDLADIMVGSFGKWKPINLEYGGFVSIKEEKNYHRPQEIFNTTVFDEQYLEPLLEKLSRVGKVYDSFYKENSKIKTDLLKMRIAHRNKLGINVIVMYDTEDEKQNIISYCEKNKYEYTQCPRYIRIMKDAISIEVKRGDYDKRA